MAPTQNAQRHRAELFPDQESTLARTDPELVDYFTDFALDEVVEHGHLDPRTRLMAQLAALIAAPAPSAYRVLVGAALTVGVTPVEIKEIVYHAVPYVGMGKAYDFLLATNEILAARGVELPLPGQSQTTPQTRAEQGRRVQEQIVGVPQVAAMYANAPDDEQHIQRWLSANCFGDHYTRGGLDLATRELLTFCLLVAQGGCDPQVQGHVRGNLNVGNDRELLITVVSQLVPLIGYPRSLNGLQAIDEVTQSR